MEKKMFIGIDIGKYNNSVAFMDKEGKELKKRVSIKNNYHGFFMLKDEIDALIYENGLSYDSCLIGFESTGHYWIGLNSFFGKFNIDTVMVKAETVKYKRKIKGAKGKNDSLDSKIIAYCLKDGDFLEIKKSSKEFLALRRLTRTRDEYSKATTRIKNKIHAWIDVNNPIFINIFKNINSITGLALLKEYPSPKDILLVSDTEYIDKFKKYTNRPNLALIKLYKEECELYIDIIPEITFAEVKEIDYYLKEIFRLEEDKESLENDILNIAERLIPIFDELRKIKGLPLIQVISLISEIGDIRNFKSSRALLGYLGLTLIENSSGNINSETKINKAGSRRSRKYLYISIMRLITFNEDFRTVYCYYKSYNRKNQNKDKEMLIAAACKFLRVLYGMMKNNSALNREELFKGYDFNNCDMEKFKEEYESKNMKIDYEEDLWTLFKNNN